MKDIAFNLIEVLNNPNVIRLKSEKTIELAKKYDFKIIRISMNVPKSRFPKNIYKKHINKLIKKYFPDSSALLTDTSDGHLDLIDSFDSLEIMVHPLKQNNLCFDRLTGYNLDKLKRLEDK